MVQFKNHSKQLVVSIKIYAGFESVVSRVKRVDRDSNASYTEKYQEHIPCSFSYKIGFIDDKFSKLVVFYGGKMQPMVYYSNSL